MSLGDFGHFDAWSSADPCREKGMDGTLSQTLIDFHMFGALFSQNSFVVDKSRGGLALPNRRC